MFKLYKSFCKYLQNILLHLFECVWRFGGLNINRQFPFLHIQNYTIISPVFFIFTFTYSFSVHTKPASAACPVLTSLSGFGELLHSCCTDFRHICSSRAQSFVDNQMFHVRVFNQLIHQWVFILVAFSFRCVISKRSSGSLYLKMVTPVNVIYLKFRKSQR